MSAIWLNLSVIRQGFRRSRFHPRFQSGSWNFGHGPTPIFGRGMVTDASRLVLRAQDKRRQIFWPIILDFTLGENRNVIPGAHRETGFLALDRRNLPTDQFKFGFICRPGSPRPQGTPSIRIMAKPGLVREELANVIVAIRDRRRLTTLILIQTNPPVKNCRAGQTAGFVDGRLFSRQGFRKIRRGRRKDYSRKRPISVASLLPPIRIPILASRNLVIFCQTSMKFMPCPGKRADPRRPLNMSRL